MVNGKQKGASFERLICKRLSLWVSDGKHEDCFWRSSMSGGRSTVAAKSGKRLAAQAGDISCIHPLGAPFIEKFMAECKHYRDLEFIGMLSGKGNLVKFWNTARLQAELYGKFPLLIAQQNRHPTFACLSGNGADILGLLERDHFVNRDYDMRVINFEVFLKYAKKP